MLYTKTLSYQYPDAQPIDFPDITLQKGEVLLICGASGSGKTTLLHLLAGLRKPSKGEIVIDNENISSFSSAKLDRFRGRHIGVVFQQSYFIQSISVLDNLLVSPYAEGKSKAISIVKRLKIDNLLNRQVSQLSVGQQQRAGIARAVMNQPKLILADEPTSALDDKSCKEVLELLTEEAKLNNATLIIVTHDSRLKSEIDTIVELDAVFN
jgi:putative ABC transport system ATP-binding protein